MSNKGFEASAYSKNNSSVFGEVKKMELRSYDENDKEDGKLEVKINPETYSRKFSTREKSSNKDKTLADGRIYRVKVVEFWETVSFTLWFDNTGVIPDSEDVSKSLKWLENKLARFDGELHATRLISFVWGNYSLKGQLKNLDIDYQYFDKNGNPLRAKASLVIEGMTHDNMAYVAKKSPDLTRQHTVEAGETLPLLCQKMYKDPTYYIQVAEANNLPHFTNLEPGQKIYFPPLV